MEKFDADHALELIEEFGVNFIATAPTILGRLARAHAGRGRDVSSLEAIFHSASVCPDWVKRAWIELIGPTRIVEAYGATDYIGSCVIRGDEWLEHPGSVGRPVLTGEVRILDDARRWVGPEVVGDVYLKMHGAPDFTFHGDPEKRAAVEHDGFITCGDIGWLDADGRLYLCDRRVDMMISGGVNIYPAEIEAALLEHPLIEDAAVFGVPDAEFGEAVAAHVQSNPGSGLTEQAVRDHVRARLAGYKVPRVVVITDRLPREESGKLLKRKLKSLYWEKAAASHA